MKGILWNKILLEEFIRLGTLSKDETDVLMLKAEGVQIVEIAEELGMSVSKVNNIIKRLKAKYDSCQQYSGILPPRNA